jgi:hypothetical protein
MDDERKVQCHQVASHSLHIFVALLIEHPRWRWRQCPIGRGDLLLHARQVRLKLDFDQQTVPGVFLLQKRCIVEILRLLEGLGQNLGMLDAVQPEDAVSLTQAAVADQIPVSMPACDAIWLNLAVRALFAGGRVVNGDTLRGMNSTTQVDQQRGMGPRLLIVREEDQVR